MKARRPELLVALALVLAGVAFRVWATDYARFTPEESVFWLTARDIALGRDFPLYGPPLTGSVAHHPGPLFYYLMALPQRLGSDPRLGGAFVAGLHGLAALMIWALFRRAGGPRAALFGLVLWLFAPWDVLYADRIWLSCVAPVWGTATLYAAVRASDSTRWQAALLFFAVSAPQLHMSAPIVWAAAACWLYLRPPKRWSRPALALGAALGALTFLPTMLFELSHGFENTRLILAKSRGKAGPMTLVNSPLRVFGNAVLASTSEISYHFKRGYWAPFDERKTYILPSGWLAWLRFHGPLAPLHLASLAVAFWGWSRTVRGLWSRVRARWVEAEVKGLRARAQALRALEPRDHLTGTLLVGLLAATALLIVSRKGYYPHYSNLLVPVALWPVALALAEAFEGGRRRALVLGALLASAVAMLLATTRYYREVDTLNGLATTEALVEAALAEDRPLSLEFSAFDNTEAWRNLARGRFGARLRLDPEAPVRWRVDNDLVRRAPGEGRLLGSVRVRREGPGAPGPTP